MSNELPCGLTQSEWIRTLRAPGTVLLRDESDERWLFYHSPRRVIATEQLDDVACCLDQAQAEAEAGAEVCGLICYEASPAMDDAMRTAVARPGMPLVWLGVYDRVERLDVLPEIAGADWWIDGWKPTTEYDRYARAFEKIKQYIADGDTYQINLTIRLASSLAGDAYSFFRELYHRQPTPYAAMMQIGSHAICSVTPELFFERRDDRIACKPMKGTRPAEKRGNEDGGPTGSDQLIQSEKDRAENAMIVDMIRNDIGRIARLGTVRATSLFDVERHPTVWQMTSTVEGRTDAGFADILRALFPCASITGAPKIRSMDIIEELEDSPRGIYTGAIGRITRDSVRMAVAIRTVCVDLQTTAGTSSETVPKHPIDYGCGGGVVWDSRLDEEYAECLTKARVVTEMRQDFSLLETMLARRGSIFLLPYHLDRLAQAAEFFRFSFNRTYIETKLRNYAAEISADGGRFRVRLLLASNGEIQIESTQIERSKNRTQAAPWKIAIAPWPIDSANPFLRYKTTHRDVYRQAIDQSPDCDDVLLYNERDEVTECTITNIVAQIDGRYLTPPVEAGLLDGTFRRLLIERGRVEVSRLTLDDIRQAERLYLINSVRGIIPAKLID